MPRYGAEAAPGSSPETAVPVAEVNGAVSRLLEESFHPLWVRGEVTNWKPHRSGHRFFSLRDDDAQLSCVMWSSDVSRLPTEPEEGMQVSAFGTLGLWVKRGDFRFAVRRIQAEGEGLWRLAFERLHARLKGEGLLDLDRKRSLPRVPGTVGVVTSKSGAALRDVIAVIRRRAPQTRVLVSDCRVQGEGAASEIVAALQRLVDEGSSDVIVLTRGGGSIEDLWAFNDEGLARAIAVSPIPTVSAVGHEIDFTIADFVADLRAPTPSAAAESVTEDAAVLRAELRAAQAGLVEGLRGRIRGDAERVRRGFGTLEAEMRRILDARRSQLAVTGGKLDGLSPLGALERGFAVPLGESGTVLRSTAEFRPGNRFTLRLVDGTVSATTSEISPLPAASAPGDAST